MKLKNYPEFVQSATNKFVDALAAYYLSEIEEIYQDWEETEPKDLKFNYPRGFTRKFVTEVFDHELQFELSMILLDLEDAVAKRIPVLLREAKGKTKGKKK